MFLITIIISLLVPLIIFYIFKRGQFKYFLSYFGLGLVVYTTGIIMLFATDKITSYILIISGLILMSTKAISLIGVIILTIYSRVELADKYYEIKYAADNPRITPSNPVEVNVAIIFFLVINILLILAWLHKRNRSVISIIWASLTRKSPEKTKQELQTQYLKDIRDNSFR